ncbi:hypothetical protein FDP41_011374 [Naegleria fowleri]|uniref:Uncharacterized protein n=1 Tax=Naegleria fowleri TaxID=5763 RepID=A0A6A5C7H4_NAEFO|nr:uncharacterized protein FDP41_011374 [Naegleria fowleri]KAF0982444.1 hypothetical protein FDP41_011374 [Naegleria fowleri]CAG4709356.1 unnamed protein product [Naegleria fowleri]
MALLASSLLSARVMFYVLRLVVVWAIRKGKFTSPNSILPHGLQVLDTPALTSEKDDIQRTSIRTLEKIAGLNVVHHHDPKNTTEEIFPKQQLILQSQMKCKKCGFDKLHKGQVRESGGLLSKLFNIQNRMFITVSCSRCSFTEYYETSQSFVSDVIEMMLK